MNNRSTAVTSELRHLNAWSMDRYGLAHGALAALVCLIAGYRIYQEPIVGAYVAKVLDNVEGRYPTVDMGFLVRRGFARRVYAGRKLMGFVPTVLALQKFPEAASVAKATPVAAASVAA